MQLTEEKIQEEIEKLEKQREGIVAQANQILYQIEGKLQLYREFLDQEANPTSDSEEK